jgi:glycosyltransferase involved in cell wall biosynthesis
MVAEGNKVTVFCGNDEHSPRNQVIDGVQIVRRGGFYMVYLWAVLYYVLRFRGNFDVVVDTENGIPFFTPLYVRVPVCLIVHHVHQEVFRQHLKPPFKNIAVFLESRVMPFLYRNVEIVTVSDSSKSQIIDLGFTNPDAIHVIHPGISKVPGVTYSKTIFPSFLCLGRLQPYKRVDVAIQAFARIKKQFASARMTIAGYGVSQNELKQLANELNVSGSVSFPGRVTEAEKARLMSVHWALVQPSFIEGWGITVIESNSFKTPVIASNVYGLKDSVVHNKTGLLVAHGDKKEFAEAMSQVIRDPVLRRSLSRESYLWSQKFNWDQSAASFIRIIYRITSQPPKVMLRRFTYETN